MRPFDLSVEAEEDIVAIAEYGVRVFGALVARRYHDELFAALDLIASNPRIARERHEIFPPVRIHPFKAHVVVYRIRDDGRVFVTGFATRMRTGSARLCKSIIDIPSAGPMSRPTRFTMRTQGSDYLNRLKNLLLIAKRV